MPPQSPLSGPVALPSPLVSPPIVSSRHDVNVTGLAAVPFATSDPCTLRYAQLVAWPLMIVPAPSVSVTPAGTRSALQPPYRTGMSVPVHGSDELTVTVAWESCTPLRPLPLPELPFSAPMSTGARLHDDRGRRPRW